MTALLLIPAVNWAVGLAALIAVGVAGAWVGLKAWHLFRRGLAVQAEAMPLVIGLEERAAIATRRAGRLAELSLALDESLRDLQDSVARFMVLVHAYREASERWHRLTSFVR